MLYEKVKPVQWDSPVPFDNCAAGIVVVSSHSIFVVRKHSILTHYVDNQEEKSCRICAQNH